MRVDDLREYIRSCGDRGATDRESAVALKVGKKRIEDLRTTLVSCGQVKAESFRRDGRTVWVWTGA